MSRAHLRALHTTIGNRSQSANLAQSTNDVMMAADDDGMADGMCFVVSIAAATAATTTPTSCQPATELFHSATFAATAVTIIIIITIIIVHIQCLDRALFTAGKVASAAIAVIAFCWSITLPRQYNCNSDTRSSSS